MILDFYCDYDIVKFAIFIRRLKEVKEAFSNFKKIIETYNPVGSRDFFHLNFVRIINVLDQNGLSNFVKIISLLNFEENIFNFSPQDFSNLSHNSIKNFGKVINVLNEGEISELMPKFIKNFGDDLNQFFSVLKGNKGNIKEEFIQKIQANNKLSNVDPVSFDNIYN